MGSEIDSSKLVDRLGRFPLPLEVVPFGHQQVLRRLSADGVACGLRLDGDRPLVTDNGNYVVDCRYGAIADPAALHAELATIPGVVETGLFVDLVDTVVVAGPDGVRTIDTGR